MTDPLSSLVECNGSHEVCRNLELIERLQREIEQYHATVDILQQTRMERDRLQRLIEDKDRIQDKQATIISGLRAALERLRDACIESNDLVYAAIATEALGPAQETPARIPPREFDIESHTGLYTEPAQETP